MALVLILLVALAPFWASTAPGSRMVLSVINRNILGTVAAADLSLSWGGPLILRDVHVRDPDGREVLEVEQVTLHSGVLDLVRSPESFRELAIQAPRAALYVDEDLQLSLVKAFRSTEPPPEEEDLPELRGRVVVQDGSARVIPLVGEPFDVRDIEGHIRLDTLNDIEASLRLNPPGGGIIIAEAAIEQLLADGRRVDVFAASGTFHVVTDGELDAAALAEAFALDAGVAGDATLDVRGTFQAGQVQGHLTAAVTRLHTQRQAGPQIEPVDLILTGQMGGTRSEVAGDLVLAGDPGEVKTQFVWHPTEEVQAPDLSTGRVLAAILNGEALDLPRFTLTTTGAIDLPALARAVPALLNLREDVEVTEGTLTLESFTFEGGAHPSASGSLDLTAVRARRDGREIELQPAQIVFEAFVEPGDGVQVRQAGLESGFLAAEGSGTATELQVAFNGDLGRLHEEWGQILEFDPQQMAGVVAGNVRLTRAGEERVVVVATLSGQGLHYASEHLRPAAAQTQPADPDRTAPDERVPEIRIQQASLEQEGHLVIEDRTVTRLEVSRGQLDIDGRIIATGSGRYNFTEGRLETRAKVERGDVAWLAALAEELGIDALSGYGGQMTMTATLDRSSSEAAFITGGQLVLRQVTREGQPLWPEREVNIEWSEGRYDPALDQSGLGHARLRSPLGNLALSELRYDHRLASMQGRVRADADLAPTLEAAVPLTEWELPPPVGGRLGWAGTWTFDNGIMVLNGNGTVRDFMVGTGERTIRQDQMRLVSNLRVDTGQESIGITQLDVASELLTLSVAGNIDQYRTTRDLALTCEYRSQWAPLVALLHGMVPATAETVNLAGAFSDRFELRGPAHQPEVRPPFRELRAQTEIAWESASVYGVELEQATLPVRLIDGRLEMPMTAVAQRPSAVPAQPRAAVPAQPRAAGPRASLHLGGVLDFAPEHPTFLLAGRQPVLEEVQVDRDLSILLLSRINPLFGHVTRIDGTASLSVEEVAIPLAEALAGASGAGELVLGELQVQPSGIFRLLLEMGHVLDPGVEPSMYRMRFSDLNFRMQDGRISYEDFRIIFADEGFDLMFTGSVGFDDRLDLVVSVPVRPRLLERFGVRGPTAGYADVLADVRVAIPLTGTREEPRLDFERVDVRPLIAEATRALAQDQARGLIGQLLGEPVGPLRERPEGPDDEADPERPRRDPLDVEERARDVLRGFLDRDRGDDRDERRERRRR